MVETRSAGGVVLNDQGQVLVVSQRGLSWSLPKGHIDPGEDAQEAARREIAEESGVTELIYLQDLGSYWRYKIGLDGREDKSERKELTLFLYRTHTQPLKPTDPDNPEARWVEPGAVADLLTHPRDKQFFRDILEEIPSLQKRS